MSLTQRIYRLEAFFLIALFLILFACHKMDTGHPGTISISKTAIRIDTAVGTVDSFSVQSTVQWTASISSGGGWLQIDKNSGTPGNTPVKLSIVSNDATIPTQVATITISAVGNSNISSVILTVTKKPFILSLGYHKELGGANEETPSRPMMATPDGGIIIAGATSSNDGDVRGNHGAADFWIVKMNASGDTTWTKTYGGSAEDRPSSIINAPGGGYVVCGLTSSRDGDIHRNQGGSDVWLMKLNANGDTLWTKTYGGTGDEHANSIIATPDGGYAMAGYTDSNDGDVHNNHGGGDVWLLKLDAAGDTLWTKTYGGSQWDEADAIITTNDGGYALACLTNSNDQDVSGFHVSPFFGFDMWIVKLDAAGNKLWAKTVGGTGDDVALSIIDTGSEFVITGYSNSNDGDATGYHGRASLNDMLVVKINNSGTIVWAKDYGGSLDDAGISVIAAPDGGYVIAGAASSKDGDVTGYHDGQGTLDMWVVKLDVDGKRQWTKTIGGIGDEVANSIIRVSDGYIIGGFTNSNDGDFSGSGYHGDFDIGIVKLFVE